jgi:hypothetical protein
MLVIPLRGVVACVVLKDAFGVMELVVADSLTHSAGF